MMWWLISCATAFQPATAWQHIDDTHLSRNYPLSWSGQYIYLQPDRYGLVRFEGSMYTSGVPVPSASAEPCLNGRAVSSNAKSSILCCDATNILTWEARDFVAEDSHLASALDIDGDGFDDLIGYEALHLYRDDGYESVPYPAATIDALVYTNHAIADLTGDGRADLVRSYYTEEKFLGYYHEFEGGTIEIHPGGPDGFAAPTATVNLQEPLIDAIPLQLDDDPQLELVGLVAEGLSDLGWDPRSYAFVRIDFDADGAPMSVVEEPWLQHVAVFCSDFCWPTLHAVGDVDGDGFDDVLLAISYNGVAPIEATALHILTGTNGFDLERPLLRLSETPERMGAITMKQALTADLNGDGLLDVVMSRDNYYYDGSSTVQVWFAPFLEPPVATADTGPTGTTRGTAETADTGRTTTPPPQGGAGSDDEGCGCHSSPGSGAWLILAFPWLTARRSSRKTP